MRINPFSAIFQSTWNDTAPAQVHAAQQLLQRDREAGLKRLDELFRSGRPPEPHPSGPYRGEFLAFQVAPGLTDLAALVVGRGSGWQGKTFDERQNRGENLLLRRALPRLRLAWPFYHRWEPDAPGLVRGLAFRTRWGPGLVDTDRMVLQIDYNLPENPRLTVCRLRDELVQLGPRFYLGKAHFHWWWGPWQTVIYFTLQ